MNIFSYQDYRVFLKNWIRQQAHQGHGMAKKLADSLGISSVLMSQVLSAKRHLQPEQAYAVTEFLSLSPKESEYFLLLVQHARAGTEKYRLFLEVKLKQARASSDDLKERVTQDIQLSESAKARFYSHWSYSAIRLLCDIPGHQDADRIAAYLGLPRATIKEALQFLVSEGLCKEEMGKYGLGARSTHLEADSPWIYSRQMHWRQKASQHMDAPAASSLFYTAPLTLSEEDAAKLRDKLLVFFKELTLAVRESRSETLYCLNLDWFPLGAKK